MADRLTVSVVVPTYRRRHMLPKILRPLLDDAATTEVVTVIDGSDDGSYDLLAATAKDDPRVKAILTERKGQAAAQQLGGEHATGDVLLFLDDDVVPDAGLVTGHALHHQEADDLVVAGYMPVRPAPLGEKHDWVVARYAGRYDRMVRRWEHDPDLVLQHLWGGNVSLRRVHLAHIPVHRTGCRITYHLDWEFGLRCLKRGMRGKFVRELRATHNYKRTVEQFLRDRAASAADRAVIHHLHGDDIGTLPDDYFWHDARGLRRAVVRLACAAPPAVVERILARGVHLAERRQLRGLEATACDYLDRVRGHRIARDVSHALRRGATGEAGQGGLR